MHCAPADLVAVTSEAQIIFSWNDVAGVNEYRIAMRPKNGTEPLQWTEHLVANPSYTISDNLVMSGLEHEVLVSAFNADYQSRWSQTITFTGPAQQAASKEAVKVLTNPPYRVGDVMHVSLASQHPFSTPSLWHWFLCNVDGSDCKLLLLKQMNSHRYVVSEIACGKRAEAQSNYRKEGVSYTARAIIGVVDAKASDDVSDPQTPTQTPVAGTVSPTPSPVVAQTNMMECPESTTSPAPSDDLFTLDTGIESLLYALKLEAVSVSIEWDNAITGGAAEVMCDYLIVATPWGRIAVVLPNGGVEYADVRVPMNLEGLLTHPDAPIILTKQFKVAGILLRQYSF